MKKIAILKSGKGNYKNGLRELTKEDIYLVESLGTEAIISEGSLENGIISGEGVSWIENYDFQITAHEYKIRGEVYTAEAIQKTLSPSHATLHRIDTIVANVNGEFEVLEGINDANPIKRTVDENSQIEITFIEVNANTTQPININILDVYNENIEFTTADNTGGKVNFDALGDKFNGTKFIKTLGFANGDEISFIDAAFDVRSYDVLSIPISTSLYWTYGATLKITFYSNGAQSGNSISVDGDSVGKYSFDSGKSDWQVVNIPIYEFNVQSSTIEKITITKEDTIGEIDFNLDLIRFQKGIVASNTTEKTHLSQFINDGIFITAEDVPKTVSETTIVSANYLQDLDYQVIADKYPMGDKYVSSTPGQVTLDVADGTNDRIDLIVAVAPIFPETIGTVGKITGTPSVNPAEPDYDRELYFPIKFVLVKIGAVIPSNPNGTDIENVMVFDEEVGGEWVFSSTDGNNNVNTNQAYSGTKSIESINSDAFNNFLLTAPSPVNVSDISGLKFRFKGNGIIDSPDSYINIGLLDNLANPTIHIKDGDFGYDASNTDWQLISISASSIPMSSDTINQVFIKDLGTSFNTYYVDKIELELYGGNTVPIGDEEFVPYTGAVKKLDLGEQDIEARNGWFNGDDSFDWLSLDPSTKILPSVDGQFDYIAAQGSVTMDNLNEYYAGLKLGVTTETILANLNQDIPKGYLKLNSTTSVLPSLGINHIWLVSQPKSDGASQINSRLQVGYNQVSPDQSNMYTLPVNGTIYTVSYIKTHKEVKEDITTTYNFVIGDRNSIVTLDNAAAISAIIPANASVAYPIGTEIIVVNKGVGVVTLSITTDTINQNIGGLTLAQHDMRTLRKITATSWVLGY